MIHERTENVTRGFMGMAISDCVIGGYGGISPPHSPYGNGSIETTYAMRTNHHRSEKSEILRIKAEILYSRPTELRF